PRSPPGPSARSILDSPQLVNWGILMQSAACRRPGAGLWCFPAPGAIPRCGPGPEHVMDQHPDSPPTSNGPAEAPTSALPTDAYVPLSYAELRPAAQAPRDWLWQGYLLPGAVTLLTSLWKSGKSTLLAVLLSRLKTGGMLAGLPVRAGRAVVISEES